MTNPVIDPDQIARRILSIDPEICVGSCDQRIYSNGKTAFLIAGERASRIEEFVKIVAEHSGVAVDWHYVGGRGAVLTCGDVEAVRGAARLLLAVLEDSEIEFVSNL